MASEKNDGQETDRAVTRRRFLQLLAAAGLLAACGRPPSVSPTSLPASTLLPTDRPTASPAPFPTGTPTPVPTPLPTAAPQNNLSTVVVTHHSGAWNDKKLVPEVLGQMLDSSITRLTGLADPAEAWASFFKPGERIGIKVNTIIGSSAFTHVPLALAVAEKLQGIGIAPEQIVIWDRDEYELDRAGFPINKDGPGVLCYGTNGKYTAGWQVAGVDVRLSDILLSCDALINMPIIKQHMYGGVSYAMKNHYGTFDRPDRFHRNSIRRAIPELNALEPIRSKQRLIVGDFLAIVFGDNWERSIHGDAITMATDPVANDYCALQLWVEAKKADVGGSAAYISMADDWLTLAAAMGLGTNDPQQIDLQEVTLA